jgi:patatin-like phospholipase/acyl hydrolase
VTASQQSRQKFRILSLDGGGIRGAFTASFLSSIEDHLANPLADHFDLIAGTSTGAIVAAGLALGHKASTIRDFYEVEGPKIFSAPWWNFGVLQSKYEQSKLSEALVGVFGNKRMRDANCRLIIPSINISGGQTVMFKTPHLPNMIRDPQRLISDVLLATTAAPYFLPQAHLDDGTYVDGGLWANNPSMTAICEALKIRDSCEPPYLAAKFELGDITLLSIGTGKPKYYMKPKARETGLLWWGRSLGKELMNVIGASQSQGYDFQAQYVLGAGYDRVNFDIPGGESWSLDAVGHLGDLLNIGKQKAVELFGGLKESYFSAVAPSFIPYEYQHN